MTLGNSTGLDIPADLLKIKSREFINQASCPRSMFFKLLTETH